MFDIVSLALNAFKVLNTFLKWLEKKGYIDEGRRQQWQKEKDELDRTMAVTDEEDARAAGDSDSTLDDELKRPLD